MEVREGRGTPEKGVEYDIYKLNSQYSKFKFGSRFDQEADHFKTSLTQALGSLHTE